MPVYKYKALDSDEKVQTGVLEAANPKDARLQLLSRNLFLLDLAGASSGENAGGLHIRSQKRADELAIVTRQFATLTKAGVPIAEALGALVDVIETPRLAVAFRDIKENVTQGMSLEDALKRHPRYFGPFYVNMVKVGEASGNMDTVLMRLSGYLHSQSRIRAKVKAALTYPVLMMAVGIAVVAFLITFVVPNITQVLVDSGKAMPAPTVILIGISGFLAGFWWLILLVIAGVCILYKTIVSTDGGRLARDSLLLKIPVFGELVRKHVVARFAMTFSTLLKSGLPALDSLEIVKQTVNNKVLENAVEEIHDRLIEGSERGVPAARGIHDFSWRGIGQAGGDARDNIRILRRGNRRGHGPFYQHNRAGIDYRACGGGGVRGACGYPPDTGNGRNSLKTG